MKHHASDRQCPPTADLRQPTPSRASGHGVQVMILSRRLAGAARGRGSPPARTKSVPVTELEWASRRSLVGNLRLENDQGSQGFVRVFDAIPGAYEVLGRCRAWNPEIPSVRGYNRDLTAFGGFGARLGLGLLEGPAGPELGRLRRDLIRDEVDVALGG
mgnify:FL=1